MSLPNHGANPEQFAKALGKTLPNDALDFSVNTNPFGPPNFVKQLTEERFISLVSSYPDPHVTTLTERLAHKNDVKKEQILVGNGAAELIFLIASVFQNKRVRIIEPAFSEYRDACLAFSCDVSSYVLSEPWSLEKRMISSIVDEIDLLFLCRPNNPTGVRYEKENVLSLIKEANRRDVFVVIDEAFYDFCEERDSLHTLCETNDNVIILRSLTKMYAIAGLRLGYVIAHEQFIQKLKRRQPPWSVNGLAQEIGLLLLENDDFVFETARRIGEERRWMKETLEQLGFHISPSKVNFFVLSEKNKSNLDELLHFLLENGIVARHTYNFRGLDGNYIRLAVKDRASNEKLVRLLTEWRLKR